MECILIESHASILFISTALSGYSLSCHTSPDQTNRLETKAALLDASSLLIFFRTEIGFDS